MTSGCVEASPGVGIISYVMVLTTESGNIRKIV